jgi:PhnB protein
MARRSSLRLCAVFGVSENPDARAPLPNGKLIHAEVQMAGANLMVFDQLEGWPARPGLLQVWVTDVAEVLALATKHGATVITPAMPLYGDTTLGRMLDPWGNIWWLWAPDVGQADLPDDAKVFSTIDEALRALNKTP